MAPSSSASRIILLLFLLLLAALFWHVSLIAPHILDDYWLNFVVEKNADGSVNYTTRLISSWNDLVESWLTRRELILNGRISDVLCALVMRGGGRELFAILNTLAMLATVGLFSLYCFRKVTLWSVLALISVFILFNPNIDGTLFWMAGACNYLWGSVLLGVFLHCLDRVMEGEERRLSAVLLGSLAGFGCGILHEGLGAPLVGGIMAYWFIGIIRGRKLPTGCKWLLLFTLLGTLVTITAPSIWIRASHEIGGGWNNHMSIVWSLAIVSAKSPFLLFLFLVWKKRKCVFSPLMWICLMLAVLMLVCSGGAWGGRFYYMSIAFLLLLMKETAFWWEQHKRMVLFICLPLVTCACAYEYCHMEKISRIFRSILSAPKQNGVCIIDRLGDQSYIPWMLENSVPFSRKDYRYPYCGKLFGQDDFYVVFRTAEIDPSRYSNFGDSNENQSHIIRLEKGYLLRLPRKSTLVWDIIAHSPQGSLHLKKDEGSFSAVANAFIKKQLLGIYSEDFHDGFHYILLPEKTMGYEYITFNISRYSPSRQQEQTESIQLKLP